ncbi:hypothetical protein [Rhodomicrobium sp.]
MIDEASTPKLDPANAVLADSSLAAASAFPESPHVKIKAPGRQIAKKI